jgi:mRNA-degrading endonuclease RelE of RelBE toxin-antitoxin system
VPLLGISGNQLFVGNTDLLDGTSILDIKPYISSVDSFPNQRQGWLDEVRDELDKPVKYTVSLSALACEQVEWLSVGWGIDFFTKARAILERAPQRSRTHRITAPKDGVFRLSSGGWRLFFSVLNDQVTVIRLAPGFPRRLLVQEGFEVVPDWRAQLAFRERWADE